MVQRIGGFRRKTRSKLKKQYGQKGKISITKFFRKFKDGDKVILKPEPAVQTGMSFPRFQGKSGVISGKQGECYKVVIKDGNLKKIVVVHPVHLNREA
ncbi:MAG: 50S ribosomal protein L21e [Nanoarchaeota archaeon]|nr:50S ribosomal protein L21e [Nanoarchaeota archaeon]MBU4242146.1 50S ribosomal protein L21e [Nanoarchaeota archaeon]MBU4351992.1 50S ribosomal protein L21e [Nanoarchaeota archaeon]MBU4455969.1 50S ribosomal protein L21e [Nanoarchaeota archaeon]MCG2720324.1 50S ribosomal protein L21e [Nanoarchaeota archaeon]